MWKIFTKDEKGFTGLEAAIVLIAFVVVAAVFSYVMLGAGFFTTQKSQEVVHTGVTQASSSVELSGDVIAKGVTGVNITNVSIFLQLTSGGSQVDMNRTLIVYSSPGVAPHDLLNGSTANDTQFLIVNRYNNYSAPDYLIDKGEKFEVLVNVSALDNITANKDFQLEIKPPQGATYTIHRKAPPAISSVMTLV